MRRLILAFVWFTFPNADFDSDMKTFPTVLNKQDTTTRHNRNVLFPRTFYPIFHDITGHETAFPMFFLAILNDKNDTVMWLMKRHNVAKNGMYKKCRLFKSGNYKQTACFAYALN